MFTNLPNGLVTNVKLHRKKSWIMISRELGDKSQAPQVFATTKSNFHNNNFRNNWGQKWNTRCFCKNAHKFVHGLVVDAKLQRKKFPETQKTFVRMLTNLLHNLVVDAKLQRKKFLKHKKLL